MRFSYGMLTPLDNYVFGIRKICDRYNDLLEYYEIVYGYQRWETEADILVFAKWISVGFMQVDEANTKGNLFTTSNLFEHQFDDVSGIYA